LASKKTTDDELGNMIDKLTHLSVNGLPMSHSIIKSFPKLPTLALFFKCDYNKHSKYGNLFEDSQMLTTLSPVKMDNWPQTQLTMAHLNVTFVEKKDMVGEIVNMLTK